MCLGTVSAGPQRHVPRIKIDVHLGSFGAFLRAGACITGVIFLRVLWCLNFGPWAHFSAQRQSKGIQKGGESEETACAGRSCGACQTYSIYCAEAHRTGPGRASEQSFHAPGPSCLRKSPETRFWCIRQISGRTLRPQWHTFCFPEVYCSAAILRSGCVIPLSPLPSKPELKFRPSFRYTMLFSRKTSKSISVGLNFEPVL